MPFQPRLESFRGDFEALAAMMTASWAENQDQSLLFDETFLRSAFAYPGSSLELAPTLYVDDRPAAFIAGLPRAMRMEGRRLRLALNTFLTASVEFKGKGYGAIVWTELVRRARSAGFDGAVDFGVEGTPTNRLIVECGKRLRVDVRRVFSVQYVVRLLKPAEGISEPPPDTIVERFMRAAAQVPASVPLARIWSREEAEWQCLRRSGALCSVYEQDSRCGVVTGYVAQVIDKTPTKVLLVDDLLWGNLEARERLVLLQQLLAQAAAAGAQMAVAPVLGYAETAPLREAGFRQSRRLIHMYLTLWNGIPAPESLGSVYLDVF